MKLLYFLVSILLLCVSSVDSAGVNTGLVLTFSNSARDEALSGAPAAVNNGICAAMTNPAGLAPIKNSQLLVFSKDCLADMHYNWIGYLQPTPFGNIAISVGLFDGGDAYLYAIGQPPQRVRAQRDVVYSISYGRKINHNFAVGMSLKYLNSDIVQRYRFGCFVGDFGMQFYLRNFVFGLALRNLSKKVTYINLEKDYLPMMLSFGSLIQLEKLKQNLFFSVSKIYKENIIFVGGLEYNIVEFLTIRGGYNLTHNLYSVGLGINLATINIDYAYIPQRDLKNEHRISLKLNF